jgi:hypothetical protein
MTLKLIRELSALGPLVYAVAAYARTSPTKRWKSLVTLGRGPQLQEQDQVAPMLTTYLQMTVPAAGRIGRRALRTHVHAWPWIQAKDDERQRGSGDPWPYLTG